MKKYLALFFVLLPSAAFACGSWTLKDLQTGQSIRFKVGGLELIDSARPDPECMSAGPDRAHFIQGPPPSPESRRRPTD